MKTKFFTAIAMLFMMQFASAQTADKKMATTQTAQTEDLSQYKGSFVAEGSKDVTVVYVQGDKLMLKAPGKPSIALESMGGRSAFKSDKDDIMVQFDTKNKQLRMKEKNVWQTYNMQ